MNGYTGNVNMSAAGLPAGASDGLQPEPRRGARDHRPDRQPPPPAAPGTYPFTVTATDGVH